jgi:hypothetical protein
MSAAASAQSDRSELGASVTPAFEQALDLVQDLRDRGLDASATRSAARRRAPPRCRRCRGDVSRPSVVDDGSTFCRSASAVCGRASSPFSARTRQYRPSRWRPRARATSAVARGRPSTARRSSALAVASPAVSEPPRLGTTSRSPRAGARRRSRRSVPHRSAGEEVRGDRVRCTAVVGAWASDSLLPDERSRRSGRCQWLRVPPAVTSR